MRTKIDRTYVGQIESAHEDVCKAGERLLALSLRRNAPSPSVFERKRRVYETCVAEHDLIIDAVVSEHWCDFYDQSTDWQNSLEGQAFERWMLDLEATKIGSLGSTHDRSEQPHIRSNAERFRALPDRVRGQG